MRNYHFSENSISSDANHESKASVTEYYSTYRWLEVIYWVERNSSIVCVCWGEGEEKPHLWMFQMFGEIKMLLYYVVCHVQQQN